MARRVYPKVMLTLATIVFALLWLGLLGLGVIVANTIARIEAGDRAGQCDHGL